MMMMNARAYSENATVHVNNSESEARNEELSLNSDQTISVDPGSQPYDSEMQLYNPTDSTSRGAARDEAPVRVLASGTNCITLLKMYTMRQLRIRGSLILIIAALLKVKMPFYAGLEPGA